MRKKKAATKKAAMAETGSIDNVIIFDRALTPTEIKAFSEIKALYNSDSGTELPVCEAPAPGFINTGK